LSLATIKSFVRSSSASSSSPAKS
jgi:hypothetical protein